LSWTARAAFAEGSRRPTTREIPPTPPPWIDRRPRRRNPWKIQDLRIITQTLAIANWWTPTRARWYNSLYCEAGLASV
jgi:hypothetical protein